MWNVVLIIDVNTTTKRHKNIRIINNCIILCIIARHVDYFMYIYFDKLVGIAYDLPTMYKLCYILIDANETHFVILFRLKHSQFNNYKYL